MTVIWVYAYREVGPSPPPLSCLAHRLRIAWGNGRNDTIRPARDNLPCCTDQVQQPLWLEGRASFGPCRSLRCHSVTLPRRVCIICVDLFGCGLLTIFITRSLEATNTPFLLALDPPANEKSSALQSRIRTKSVAWIFRDDVERTALIGVIWAIRGTNNKKAAQGGRPYLHHVDFSFDCVSLKDHQMITMRNLHHHHPCSAIYHFL